MVETRIALGILTPPVRGVLIWFGGKSHVLLSETGIYPQTYSIPTWLHTPGSLESFVVQLYIF